MFESNFSRNTQNIFEKVNFVYTKGVPYCCIPIKIAQVLKSQFKSSNQSSLFVKFNLVLQNQSLSKHDEVENSTTSTSSSSFICVEWRNQSNTVTTTPIDIYYNESCINTLKPFLNTQKNVFAYIELIPEVFDALEVTLLPKSYQDWDKTSKKANMIEDLFMRQYNSLYLNQEVCICLTPSLKVYFTVTNIRTLTNDLNLNTSDNTQHNSNNNIKIISRLSTETLLFITPVIAPSLPLPSPHTLPTTTISTTSVGVFVQLRAAATAFFDLFITTLCSCTPQVQFFM